MTIHMTIHMNWPANADFLLPPIPYLVMVMVVSSLLLLLLLLAPPTPIKKMMALLTKSPVPSHNLNHRVPHKLCFTLPVSLMMT